jgi:ureidoglycolate dehydrogenase (NAD+)
MNSHLVSAPDLELWVTDAFISVGLTESDSRLAAIMLVQTSLWGIDSHGVARVPHYLERISTGSIRAVPQMDYTATGAATGSLDGDHGLGFIVCQRAMEEAITLAHAAGVGVVGVKNSSHCGAIGLYTRQAVKAGMIGIAFTHSDSFVAPHRGKSAFFGTNPISIAIPSTDAQRPLCLDMATSIVPWNRIMNARRENSSIPFGYGVNRLGEDTTNPHEVTAVKPMADHKGYAMAFLIDMLCGPLNGMAFGTGLTKMYEQLEEHRRLGSLMIALDPGRFSGGSTLAAQVAAAIAAVTGQNEGILYPGEPEYISAESRGQCGIPIEPGLWPQMEHWSSRMNIPLPQTIT